MNLCKTFNMIWVKDMLTFYKPFGSLFCMLVLSLWVPFLLFLALDSIIGLISIIYLGGPVFIIIFLASSRLLL